MEQAMITGALLVWLGAAVIAIVIAAFLIRILWMPSDDGFGFSGTAAADRPTGQVRPRLKTKHDVIEFFLRETADQDLAHILTDAAELNGRDGFVDVRQGGDGQPYRVEHTHRPEEEVRADTRSFAEVRQEVERLKAARDTAVTEDERDRFNQQIAWLAGGISILWINLPNSAEYESRRTLIRDTIGRFKRACATNAATPNP